MQQLHLVKKDIDPNTSLEIATYHTPSDSGCEYVICKNEKRIGWASTEHNALQIHDMYVRIHILHETDDEPNCDAKINEMQSVSQNNGFLHDIPEEELAEKQKLLPWNRNS